MFTVQTERPAQSVGAPAALVLGVIAALAIFAFVLAVPQTPHASHARIDPVAGHMHGAITPVVPSRH